MLTEKKFQAGGVSINYVEGPASGVPLVMLHGVTGRWQTYMEVMPFFGWRYHLYALDLRGHGCSSRTPGAYCLEHFGEDVVRFVEERIAAPAILMGHSLGAEVALWAAAAAPALTRAVVLEDPGLYTISEGRFPQHPIHQLLNDIYQMLANNPTLHDIITVLRRLLPEDNDVGRRAWATSLLQLDPDVLTHILQERTMAGIRHDDLLAQIRAPVLLLQGNAELGGTINEQDAQRAIACLAQCTHVYRSDLGHFFHSEIPMPFFQLVCSFLESL